MSDLTAARLRELYHYDPSSGKFTRLAQVHSWRAGVVEGRPNGGGYRRLMVDGKRYQLHHLAWLYVHGKFPVMLDHINGDRSGNRIENLREATPSQNSANAQNRKDNKSDYRGVHFNKKLGKFTVHIGHQGDYKYLGCFPTIEEAVAVREAKAGELFGDFVRAGPDVRRQYENTKRPGRKILRIRPGSLARA